MSYRTGAVDSRIRALRPAINVSGPTAAEAEMMAEAVRTHCPIFATLIRAAPIEITNHLIGPEGPGVMWKIEFL